MPGRRGLAKVRHDELMALCHLVDVGAVRGTRLVLHGPAANHKHSICPLCTSWARGEEGNTNRRQTHSGEGVALQRCGVLPPHGQIRHLHLSDAVFVHTSTTSHSH